jgi:hypothetical protein
MPKLKESAIEKYFIERVTETGGETRKVIWPGRKGAPDRLAGWPNGRHAFVELKSDQQSWKLQPAQAREIKRMRSWGIMVWVIASVGEVDHFIICMTGE